MLGRDVVNYVLSLKTEEDKIQFLEEFCLKRIVELTGDENLGKKLASKNVTINIMSRDEVKKVFKEMGGINEYAQAFYSLRTKNIYTPHIEMESDVIDFVHEFLHALSHYYDGDGLTKKLGVKLPPTNENYKQSNLFNEGMNTLAVNLVLGYNASSSYSEDRMIVQMVQAMCGLSDVEMLRANFDEEAWITKSVKENFNPNDAVAFERFLENYTDLRDPFIVEEVFIPNASEKTRERARVVAMSFHENSLEEEPYDGDSWGMV